ncbi:hypothetical protein LSTR_LSTR007761 [Laodelphax striatellus]|uniref:SURP motif domain-containing protein n=1 Tax=Laodelphax striatellus TaxID=195883 RepID=A0A482XR25_LAOST|nr:hypothetical protein LSTR_LSTR007761 [Laodelphax striatellus]
MAYPRQNWQVNESGRPILRKKDEPEEELLVFGYACKLFRDDEKALYVDQGKHLIPWMGNDSLRIDRYDVRGAVYDLSQFETTRQEEPLWFNLSQEEMKIEQMCDEERYRALTTNEDEEALYQEEELKRLHQALGSDKAYGQVSYKYDDEDGDKDGDKNGEEDRSDEANNQKEELDEPFKAPVELDLPQGMVIPESVKLNAIIEKTAMFIDRQGSQMEIVLKLKQSNNPQFNFLSLNSPLHPYYRFLLSAIKTGRYRPVIPSYTGVESGNDQENTQLNSGGSYYLHGSLAGTSSSNNVDVAPVIPTINYKTSADCAYSMLVNRIKGNQSKFSGATETGSAREESNSNSYDGVAVTNEELVGKSVPPQDLEEDSKGSLSPVSRPSRPPKRRRSTRQQGACAYYDPIEQENEYPIVEGPALEEETVMYCEPPPVQPEITVPVPEVVTVPTQPVIDTPPADLQLIIDKMASYVAKNGRDFESIVRSKGDPRFHFLNPTNQFYPYYLKQVERYESVLKPSVCEETTQDQNNHTEAVENVEENSCDSLKKESSVRGGGKKSGGGMVKPVPVCFSIKKPKESEGLEIKSALPVEESSEGEGEEEEGRGGEEGGEKEEKVVGVGEVKEEKGVENVAVEKKKKVVEVVVPEKVVQEERKVKEVTKEKKVGVKEKEKTKVMGKVREKLSEEKEREKQLERKRRAAAFLNLINKHKDTNPEPVIGPQLPPELAANLNEEKSGGENSLVSTPPSALSSPNNNPTPQALTTTEVPTIEIEDSADEEKAKFVRKVVKRKGSSHRSSNLPSAKAYMEYYKASESKRLRSEYEMLKHSRRSGKKKSSKSSSDRKHSRSDHHHPERSSKRRRSSREESSHHRKHKHRRRTSESGGKEGEEEKRKKRKHKEKSYKAKKHKRKEKSEESSSESSSSSSSSDSD